MKKFNKIKPTKDLHQELKHLKQKLADRDLEISILKDLVKKNCPSLESRRLIADLININDKASFLTSFPVSDLVYSKLRNSDGGGDLIFRTTSSWDTDGRMRTKESGFIGLDSVDEVEKTLLKYIT